MKASLIGLILLVGWAVQAQTATTPTTNSVTGGQSHTVEAPKSKAGEGTTFVLRAPKANEIFRGKLAYSGVAVEVLKTRHPLQLLNPLAPAEYGSPEDNVARDAINGRVIGLKLFSVHF